MSSMAISSGEKDFFKVFTIYVHGGHLGHVTQLILYKFSFLFYHKLSHKIWFQMTQLFLRKTSFNFEIWVIFGKGQRMTLTFDTQSTSITHLVEFFNNF